MIRVLILFLPFILSCFLIACKQTSQDGFPGYVEGYYTYVSAYTSGILNNLSVAKGQQTKAGDLLFILADQASQYDLQSAEERLNQAKEQEKQLQKEYDLQKSYVSQALPNQQRVSRDQMNQAYANLQVGRKSVNVVRSNVDKAKWAAGQKDVHAPKDGTIFDIYYNIGEFVQAGSPVLSILDRSKLKIIFYIPEDQSTHVKLNAMVDAFCDQCLGPIKSKIIFISPEPEYSPPVIYSNEARQKLVYRIEANVLSDYSSLHPGQPVTVRLTNK